MGKSRERWREIVVKGTMTHYEVSDLGRVRNQRTGHIKVQHANVQTGYMFVTIPKPASSFVWPKSGRPNWPLWTLRVASLVMQAFVGPRPLGKQIDHRDGIKAHNALRNLRYVTQSENIRRSYAAGRRHGNGSRLTAKAHQTIKQLWSGGLSMNAVAGRTNVDISTVSRIVRGKTKPTPTATRDIVVEHVRCPICHDRFPDHGALAAHAVGEHRPVSAGRVLCWCGQEFAGKQFATHLARVGPLSVHVRAGGK